MGNIIGPEKRSNPSPSVDTLFSRPHKPLGIASTCSDRQINLHYNGLRSALPIKSAIQSRFMDPTSRFGQPTIASAPSVSSAPSVQSVPTYKTQSVEALSSYKLWDNLYCKYKMEPDVLDQFSSRLNDNADHMRRQNEAQAHQIRLQRIREDSRLITERPALKPTLSISSCIDLTERISCLKKYDFKYFSSVKKLPELTPEMLFEIGLASKPNPPSEVLVEIDGAQILRKDVNTLNGLNWLNDEIINAYMNLLVMRGGTSGYKRVYAFNTFFYPKVKESGYSSVRRWTRRVDIFSYSFLIVPVHLGNHWCLAFIDFTQRTISYYDSLGGHSGGCCDTLLDYLREESSDKKKQDFDDENWRLIDRYSEGIPKQRNCSDCGVFACAYAEYLTRQAKFNFTQEHMPYFRKKMIYEITKKRILV